MCGSPGASSHIICFVSTPHQLYNLGRDCSRVFNMGSNSPRTGQVDVVVFGASGFTGCRVLAYLEQIISSEVSNRCRLKCTPLTGSV